MTTARSPFRPAALGAALLGCVATLAQAQLLPGVPDPQAQTRAAALAEKPPLPANCKVHYIPVPVGQGSTVYGELCMPTNGTTPTTIQLLLHGITYHTMYWDFPLHPERYSYVDYMTQRGYATLNIDRIGIGASSHPPSALITLDSNAAMANAISKQLKAGSIGAKAWKHVIFVGHSGGTATSWLAASLLAPEAGGADAIIGTGWAHQIEPEPLARFFSGFYPAALDPKFMGDPTFLDLGYQTPMPGGRNSDFLYNLNHVDPVVVQIDEVLKQTVTGGEGATLANRYSDNHTKSIKASVFMINGQQELFFCGPSLQDCRSGDALRNANEPYFSPAACLTAAVVPNAGHNLNLQLNAQTTYKIARAFADGAVGTKGQKVASYRASCQDGRTDSGGGLISGSPFSSLDLTGPDD